MSTRKDSDSEGRDPVAAEKETLSARMLALIEIATVEERRKLDNGESPEGESRRRTDHKTGDLKRAS